MPDYTKGIGRARGEGFFYSLNVEFSGRAKRGAKRRFLPVRCNVLLAAAQHQKENGLPTSAEAPPRARRPPPQKNLRPLRPQSPHDGEAPA
jgi:hypothetical protein